MKYDSLALVLAAAMAVSTLGSGKDYQAQILKWRAEREAELRADDGWLTLAGLFWLKEGDNAVGSDSGADIVLPEGAAPARAGVFEFHSGRTTLRAAPGSSITLAGKPVTAVELQSDEHQKPDVLRLGSLSFHVIKRGVRFGVRVKDLNSRNRREFSGMRWYAVNQSYLVTADFLGYGKPEYIDIVTRVGDVVKMESPGYVVFMLNGSEQRLDPLLEDGKLFFVFADLTNGKATYGAGRFLYADPPKDGKVILDFNQAVNPPCAFTPFSTCPLPPRQNRLKIAIEAGELAHHGS